VPPEFKSPEPPKSHLEEGILKGLFHYNFDPRYDD
jgi:hypothetical protein